MTSLVPVGPGIPADIAAVLKSHQQALRQIQQPDRPVVLPHVALKADLPAADSWKECAVICDEINSVCVSTLVSGSYAWKRADGGAI